MADLPVPVAPGARVEARDGLIGRVSQVVVSQDNGEPLFLMVQPDQASPPVAVSFDLVESIPNKDEVYLRVERSVVYRQAAGLDATATATQTFNQTTTQQSSNQGQGLNREVLEVPLVEERLNVAKQTVDIGEMLIHKRIEQVEEVQSVPLVRDELEIQRVPMNQSLAAPVQARHEGEWLIVPVMKEVLVVEKRLMLVEEIRIRKHQVTEEQEVREQLRVERVEVEDQTRSTGQYTSAEGYVQPS